MTHTRHIHLDVLIQLPNLNTVSDVQQQICQDVLKVGHTVGRAWCLNQFQVYLSPETGTRLATQRTQGLLLSV